MLAGEVSLEHMQNVVITLNQQQLGSILGALFYLADAIVLAAIIRAFFNK